MAQLPTHALWVGLIPVLALTVENVRFLEEVREKLSAALHEAFARDQIRLLCSETDTKSLDVGCFFEGQNLRFGFRQNCHFQDGAFSAFFGPTHAEPSLTGLTNSRLWAPVKWYVSEFQEEYDEWLRSLSYDQFPPYSERALRIAAEVAHALPKLLPLAPAEGLPLEPSWARER